MQARGDSHADDSHAAASARVGLSCAVTGSCTGRRSLSSRVLCSRVVDTRRGDENSLGDGRGKQADGLRRGGALGEYGTRQELEGRSEGRGSVHMHQVCRQYPTPRLTHSGRERERPRRCQRYCSRLQLLALPPPGRLPQRCCSRLPRRRREHSLPWPLPSRSPLSSW